MAINPQMEISPVEVARAARGISLADLAARSGVARETLRNGIANPEQMTLAELSAVAHELGENPLDLARPVLADAA